MLSVGEHQHLSTSCVVFLVCSTTILLPCILRKMLRGGRHTDSNISIVAAVAAHLDLNDLDSLSRICRGVHNSLLQSRSILLKSTLHCSNEEVPVDPDSTLRYRARAGNWFYMEDTSRGAHYNGKAGSCARDLVAECRKCGTIVCRVSPTRPSILRSGCSGKSYKSILVELCDKTARRGRPARQTSPTLSALPESPYRLSFTAAPGLRAPARLPHSAAGGGHMRDGRGRVALPALRSRHPRVRLRVSRVRPLPSPPSVSSTNN